MTTGSPNSTSNFAYRNSESQYAIIQLTKTLSMLFRSLKKFRVSPKSQKKPSKRVHERVSAREATSFSLECEHVIRNPRVEHPSEPLTEKREHFTATLRMR